MYSMNEYSLDACRRSLGITASGSFRYRFTVFRAMSNSSAISRIVNGAEILGHWGGVIVYHWRDD